jgi:hypothetical protein
MFHYENVGKGGFGDTDLGRAAVLNLLGQCVELARWE